MTVPAKNNDYSLVLATHDLVTSIQLIFGQLDRVEPLLPSTECSTSWRCAWDALDDLTLFVGLYRKRLIDHTEFGQSLTRKIESVATAITVFVAELQGKSVPAARAALLPGAARKLTWVGRVTVNLVLGLGDWRNAPANPVDLRALLTATFGLHEAQAQDKGLEFALELAHSDASSAPEWLVTTVVGNLVSNAIKYTDRGRVVISSASLDDGGVEVAVTDTGLGMDAETLHTLTHLWARDRQVVGEGREGQGLGLTLADWAARAFGAQLSFSSQPGVGTRASLLIPAHVHTLPAQSAS